LAVVYTSGGSCSNSGATYTMTSGTGTCSVIANQPGNSNLFCCVPGRHKSAAVKAMMDSPISGACPATALRTHAQCTVYLDRESNSLREDHEPNENHRA